MVSWEPSGANLEPRLTNKCFKMISWESAGTNFWPWQFQVDLENASTLLPAAELLGVNFKPGSGNNSK